MVFATIAPRRLFTGFKGLGGENIDRAITQRRPTIVYGGRLQHWWFLISGDDDSILIHSPELGECRIGRKSIQSFHFHVPFAATDEAPLLSAWSTKTLAQPRWQAANAEQTNDASRSLIGTMAAELSLPNSNGETIKLSDHLGKVVVLDFLGNVVWTLCGIVAKVC